MSISRGDQSKSDEMVSGVAPPSSADASVMDLRTYVDRVDDTDNDNVNVGTSPLVNTVKSPRRTCKSVASSAKKCKGDDAAKCNGGICCILWDVKLSPLPPVTPSPPRPGMSPSQSVTPSHTTTTPTSPLRFFSSMLSPSLSPFSKFTIIHFDKCALNNVNCRDCNLIVERANLPLLEKLSFAA